MISCDNNKEAHSRYYHTLDTTSIRFPVLLAPRTAAAVQESFDFPFCDHIRAADSLTSAMVEYTLTVTLPLCVICVDVRVA
jgi:hypothetical protein